MFTNLSLVSIGYCYHDWMSIILYWGHGWTILARVAAFDLFDDVVATRPIFLPFHEAFNIILSSSEVDHIYPVMLKTFLPFLVQSRNRSLVVATTLVLELIILSDICRIMAFHHHSACILVAMTPFKMKRPLTVST